MSGQVLVLVLAVIWAAAIVAVTWELKLAALALLLGVGVFPLLHHFRKSGAGALRDAFMWFLLILSFGALTMVIARNEGWEDLVLVVCLLLMGGDGLLRQAGAKPSTS